MLTLGGMVIRRCCSFFLALEYDRYVAIIFFFFKTRLALDCNVYYVIYIYIFMLDSNDINDRDIYYATTLSIRYLSDQLSYG